MSVNKTTMKRWETTYHNNHIKLKKVHIGLAIFYIVLFALWFKYAVSFANPYKTLIEHLLAGGAYFLPFIILHLLLAYGANNKIEMSRKVSEIVFAIMLLAFPIGTLLSIYHFLPTTLWEAKNKS